MKISLSIKLKAVFLLVVFSLSTLVSFACAVGLDMGYNKNHHTNQNNTPRSSELAGNSHDHLSKDSHKHSSVNKGKGKDHHDEISHQGKKEAGSTESTPDDCCKDEAAKFEKCDKRSQQVFNYNLQAIFITLFISPAFNADATNASLHTPNSRNLIRNHHPPIADTRIAIQSFLI